MKQIFLTYFFTFFSIVSGFTQWIKPAINFPEGYRYNTESSVELSVEQEFMGIRYNTKMEVNTIIFMQVKGNDADSNYIFSASYSRMNIRVASLLINMEVSTESILPSDSLSAILITLKGKEFRILLSRNGRIIEISDLDEMITETIATSPLKPEQKLEFTRNLIQSLGKDVLLDNFSSNKSFYPKYQVKAPSEWDFKSDIVKSGIPMELNSHIHLKSISHNNAVMISDGKILQQNSTQAPDQLPLVKNLEGNEVSEIRMDIKTGMILESIVSQSVTGILKTSPEPGGSNEMIIPFKIISRSTIINTPLK